MAQAYALAAPPHKGHLFHDDAALRTFLNLANQMVPGVLWTGFAGYWFSGDNSQGQTMCFTHPRSGEEDYYAISDSRGQQVRIWTKKRNVTRWEAYPRDGVDAPEQNTMKTLKGAVRYMLGIYQKGWMPPEDAERFLKEHGPQSAFSWEQNGNMVKCNYVTNEYEIFPKPPERKATNDKGWYDDFPLLIDADTDGESAQKATDTGYDDFPLY